MAGARPVLSWSDVQGMRAGVWGLGVEGRASLRKLTTLGAEAVLVDDRPSGPGPDGRPVLATAEGGHGGVRPVVGHVGNDGEPRPAVGAVDERVRIPPVRGVDEFGQAVGAHRAVRGHQGGALRTWCAGGDGEPRNIVWLDGF